MKKLGEIWNKAIEPLGRSEAERTMKLFYGPKFKPYSVTDEQGEIVSNIIEKLFENDRFSELMDVAVEEMQKRITPAPEPWKIEWAIFEELTTELYALAMTDVLTKREISDEAIEFFAEYLIASYLADGTQMARPFDKHEKTLKYLEDMIKENGYLNHKDYTNLTPSGLRINPKFNKQKN